MRQSDEKLKKAVKRRRFAFSLLHLFTFSLFLFSAACQSSIFQSSNVAPATLRDVAAVRLGFRYEADIPAPSEQNPNAQTDELYPAVRADFDANRQSDLLAKTIVSPNKQRVLVAYSHEGDMAYMFRLDMYSADGKFLRRVTPDAMAVDFPDSIVWSPDSTNVAFVAVTREGGMSLSTLPTPGANTNSSTPPNSQSNVNANANTNANLETPTTETPATSATPPPVAPPNVLTFRTEQIYLCTSEGTDVKPLTQNEGLIYYYFVWSPDGSALAALASRADEWRYFMAVANQAGEKFVPAGRPRIIEKNGRERALDDSLTRVHPVWSPDSSKIAVALDKPAQIRIYDAIGNAPTQAAIPLRNQLLISSQAFDRVKNNESAETNSNANPETVSNASADQSVTTLPDEKTLVSFQPIIKLDWAAENILYFQTGYVREYVNAAENRYSSLRWHRLILSSQGTAIK